MAGQVSQGAADKMYNSVHIVLKGKNNVTYSGTLVLNRNWPNVSTNLNPPGGNQSDTEKPYDEIGAGYYVIAVVLVYGMSIVLLIASHIKRRHEKEVEDKQIDQYLQDFQIVKEASARDSYKNLKKSIMTKIKWEHSNRDAYRTLKKSVIPLIAIGIPGGGEPMGFPSQSATGKGYNYERRRSSFPKSHFKRERRMSAASINVNPDQAPADGVFTTLLEIYATEEGKNSSGSIDKKSEPYRPVCDIVIETNEVTTPSDEETNSIGPCPSDSGYSCVGEPENEDSNKTRKEKSDLDKIQHDGDNFDSEHLQPLLNSSPKDCNNQPLNPNLLSVSPHLSRTRKVPIPKLKLSLPTSPLSEHPRMVWISQLSPVSTKSNSSSEFRSLERIHTISPGTSPGSPRHSFLDSPPSPRRSPSICSEQFEHVTCV